MTKVSPFEANYGFSPRTNWLETKKPKQINTAGSDLYEGWTSVWQEMRENVEKAQAHQRKWYDKKNLPAPVYDMLEDVAAGRAKVAGKVMLNRHNIKTKRPTEKLDHKYFGPFVIKRKVGQRAYELELPPRMSIHPVFYVEARTDAVWMVDSGCTRHITGNKEWSIPGEPEEPGELGEPREPEEPGKPGEPVEDGEELDEHW